MPLLALTWMSAVLAMTDKRSILFQILFAVFDSLQGFVIVMVHCILRREVSQVQPLITPSLSLPSYCYTYLFLLLFFNKHISYVSFLVSDGLLISSFLVFSQFYSRITCNLAELKPDLPGPVVDITYRNEVHITDQITFYLTGARCL